MGEGGAMSNEHRPPVLGEFTIARVCNRRINKRGEPETICGQPARFHVIWDAQTIENSYTCLDHAREATEHFGADAWHGMGSCCGMPGSWYSPEKNVCYYPDDELPVAEKVREERVVRAGS